MNKRIVPAAVFVFPLFLTAAVYAQSVDNYIELLRSDIQTEKKVLVAQVMNLSDAEATAFWPIYNEYEAELHKVGDARVAVIKDFAQNMDTMTDEKAKELTDKAFKFREDRLKLGKKYYKKVSKALSPTQAAKWSQVENQINTLIDLQIASELPLVEKPSAQ